MRDSTVVTEGAEGDAVKTEIQVEETPVQRSAQVRTRLAESPRPPESLRISALQWTEPPGRARSTGSIAPSMADRCRADLAARRRSCVTSPDLEHDCKGGPLAAEGRSGRNRAGKETTGATSSLQRRLWRRLVGL